MNTHDLTGQAAIVTGSAMGIGRASALALAAAGAALVIADIDEAAGRAVAAEIEATGARAIFVRTDVTSLSDFDAARDAMLAAFGRVDILVNNAALALGGSVHEIDEAAWTRVISTNLTSVWRGMRSFVPAMIAAGSGAIVNMSSAQGLRGFRGWAAYAAAKGGINALTRQAAIDLAPHGIRVNAVAPGTIMTPLNVKVFEQSSDPDELIQRWNNAHPLGRFGEAEEVASAVTFLAGSGASFITGTVLPIDGGLTARGE